MRMNSLSPVRFAPPWAALAPPGTSFEPRWWAWPTSPLAAARSGGGKGVLLTDKQVLSVVRSNSNGPVVAEAARLYIDPDDVVLDVTYGRGYFWTHFRPTH